MCLGIPMRVEEIDGNVALAVLAGTKRRIFLDVLDEEIGIGDHVIVHAGFAIHKIPEEEARETLSLFAEAGVFQRESIPERDDGIH